MADQGPWEKSPPELVERFGAAVAGIDGLERRQMFGYPAAFIGGNMVTGLHRDSWIVRLSDDGVRGRLDDGWEIFEPMPGRPMRSYVAMPPSVADDPDAARTWVEVAAAHVRTLPVKVPKPRKPRTAKPG